MRRLPPKDFRGGEESTRDSVLLVCECTEDGDDVEILSPIDEEMGVCFVLRMVRPGVVAGGSSPAGEVEREICGDHNGSEAAAGGVGGGVVSVAGNCG